MSTTVVDRVVRDLLAHPKTEREETLADRIVWGAAALIRLRWSAETRRQRLPWRRALEFGIVHMEGGEDA